MRNWFMVAITWESGEMLTNYNYCTYNTVLKRLPRMMRACGDDSICISVRIEKCVSEQQAHDMAFGLVSGESDGRV